MLAKLLLQKVRPDALILEASSGKRALELFDEHHPDLVFMDVQMPEMDGYETTRKMRERQKTGARTPVIALTAGVTVVERRNSENAGMDGFLAKPIDIGKLKETLHRYLGQATASDTPDFNRAALEKRLDYNQEIFKALFPVNLSVSLGQLRSAIETGENDKRRYELHKLLGVCRSMSFERMAETVELLQRAVTSDIQVQLDLLGRLESSFAYLKNEQLAV
jgi:CheY-like chemotaxis protein